MPSVSAVGAAYQASQVAPVRAVQQRPQPPTPSAKRTDSVEISQQAQRLLDQDGDGDGK